MRINIAATFVVICVLSLSVAEMANAQRGGGRGGGRGGFGRGGGNGVLGLLQNESVMTEIELVDEQKDEIQTIQDELRQEMRERMEEMRDSDMSREERREAFMGMREEMEERQEEIEQQIEGVLLPEQLKRLKQLEIQRSARRTGGGAMGVLASDELMEKLGIDEEQRKKLEEKAAEVKKKLQERIKKLTKEAEDDILSVLSPSQRKEFREKIGESFEFEDGNDRRGRGGDRGGRGGDRRGGRPENDA